MLSAKEIMIKEGWVPGTDGIKQSPEEMMAIMNEKYPKQKQEIIIEMIMALTNDSNVMNDIRKQMLSQAMDAIHMLDAHNAGYAKLGRSPMINDKTSYRADNSDELVAQDMEIGLKVYNSCAEYCRIYNAAKLEEGES